MSKIATVVITYNRLPLLKEVIQSLRRQTLTPDALIVVNNASTDGTGDWLDTQPDLKVIHQANVGGAGGFDTGLQAAYDLGYDYIWVMDDDVEARPDCLERLMDVFRDPNESYDVLQTDRFADAAQSRRWRYGTEFNFSNPFKPMGVGKGMVTTDAPGFKVLPIVSFPFEGPIFKREVIEKTGRVEKDFFIMYDDTDYSMRVTQRGFKIGVVPDAILWKKVFPPASSGLKADFKLYYIVRNSILMDRKYGGDFFAFVRNTRSCLRQALVFTKQIVVDRRVKDYKAFGIMARAFRDGFRWKTQQFIR
jgi:GT2 family glycosyltransferase